MRLDNEAEDILVCIHDFVAGLMFIMLGDFHQASTYMWLADMDGKALSDD